MSNFLQDVGLFLDCNSNEEKSTGGLLMYVSREGLRGWFWKPASCHSSTLRSENLCLAYGPSSMWSGSELQELEGRNTVYLSRW